MGAVRRVTDLPAGCPVGGGGGASRAGQDADQTEAGEGVRTWLDEGSVSMVLQMGFVGAQM